MSGIDTSFKRGSLSLKGGGSLATKKSKKKKGKKRGREEEAARKEKEERDAAAAAAEGSDGGSGEGGGGGKGAGEEGEELSIDDFLTPAQKRFKEQTKERERLRIQEAVKIPHKERIEMLNADLATRTEHNDIPRVSAAGNG